MLFALLSTASLNAFQNCSASANCQACNSGAFTINCQCNNPPANTTCQCTAGNCQTCTTCCVIISLPNGGSSRNCAELRCDREQNCSARNDSYAPGPYRASKGDYFRQAAYQQETPKRFSTLPITVSPGPVIELEIIDPKAVMEGSDLVGVAFSLRNKASQNISAIKIDWFAWTSADESASFSSTFELGVGGGIFRPGDVWPNLITAVRISPRNAISRIEGTVRLIELNDGTVIGSDPSFLQKVVRERTAARTFLVYLEQRLRSLPEPERNGAARSLVASYPADELPHLIRASVAKTIDEEGVSGIYRILEALRGR
jgi:hypothetical protein